MPDRVNNLRMVQLEKGSKNTCLGKISDKNKWNRNLFVSNSHISKR